MADSTALVHRDQKGVTKSQRRLSPFAAAHEGHCFVVMPFGRNPDDVRRFRGWFVAVIEPAVRAAGYVPVLSATEQRPNAINDEIRAHLAFDPMVVVDLGGATAESEPNSNVMYELGIRHALDLPVVMMAWEGQQLPFDIRNQRVIVDKRDFLSIESNKANLTAFLQQAAIGHYYRPMEAVGRVTALDLASEVMARQTPFGAVLEELRELRQKVEERSVAPSAGHSNSPATSTVKQLLGSRQRRAVLYKAFFAAGATQEAWSRLLESRPSAADAGRIVNATDQELQQFARDRIPVYAALLENGKKRQAERRARKKASKLAKKKPAKKKSVNKATVAASSVSPNEPKLAVRSGSV